MKCQAHKTNGEPCKSKAVTGRRVCWVHGGASPAAGPTHPNWKHGRRSKYIPARLAEKYAESLTDPQLTEYRHDIALLESRLHELLTTGESESLWNQVHGAYKAMRDAMRDRDEAGITASLVMLDSLINRGMADALRWREIYQVTDQIGKTKEREHRRLVQAGLMVSQEQLIAILGQLVNVAKATFTNQDEVRKFAAALNAYGVADVREASTRGN